MARHLYECTYQNYASLSSQLGPTLKLQNDTTGLLVAHPSAHGALRGAGPAAVGQTSRSTSSFGVDGVQVRPKNCGYLAEPYFNKLCFSISAYALTLEADDSALSS